MDLSVLTPKIVLEFVLRYLHFLGGITWIGFLYWFNLVNVNFQKNLEADVKPKVNPKLMPPSLWFFRWGAVLTVLTGFLYYVSILHGEPESGVGKPLIAWLLILGISYVVQFNLIQPEGTFNNGKILAAAISVLVVLMASALFLVYKKLGVMTNPAYSIGIGGGLGVFMLLNVWGIIWPAQKRILGLVPLKEGEDKLKLARKAFLASRTNAFLSLPMLFFMGASTHLQLIRWY